MAEKNDDFGKNFGMLIAGFGVGMLVGSVLGLLFAPKSGRELRSEISERGTEYYGRAREGMSEAYLSSRDKLQEAYQQSMDALDSAMSASKDYTRDKVERVKKSVEEGIKVAKAQIKSKPEDEGEEEVKE